MPWQNLVSPALPVIPGLVVSHLWVAGFGTSTVLQDAIGSDDLVLDRGVSNLSGLTPGGFSSMVFDGTQRFVNGGLAFEDHGLCAFVLPGDTNVDLPFCGVGNAGSFLAPGEGPNSSSFGVRVTGTLEQAAGPAMQFFVPLVSQSPGFLQVFNNSNGGSGVGAYAARSGLALGSSHPGEEPSFRGQFFGLLVFETPVVGFPSFAQMDALASYWFMSGAVPVPELGQKLLALSGDSIQVGTTLTHAQSLPALIASLLPSWSVYSVGCPGIVTDSAVARDLSFVDPAFSAVRSRNSAALIGEPSNQINAGATAGACLSSVDAWRVARNAAGFDAVVCSCLARTDFDGAREAVRVAFNAGLRAVYDLPTFNPFVFGRVGSDDRLADIAAIPGMTLADGVHPDAAGAALIAPVVSFAVDPVSVIGVSSRRVRGSARSRSRRR